MTSYEECSAEFPDVSTQLPELLKCLSTAQDEARADLALGLDAFFLIYAGSLVLYVFRIALLFYSLVVDHVSHTNVFRLQQLYANWVYYAQCRLHPFQKC
jgi:hypothetical protein